MDTRRAVLWNRLGLGPIWTERQAPGAAEAQAAGADVAGEDAVTVDAAAQSGRAVERMGWDELERTVAGCAACGLCKGRTRTVFGIGDHASEWMVIGEAPGAEEDLRGEPFVGQAGRLLDSILGAAGLGRTAGGHAAVYIANVVKCRPPGNRNPEPEEAARCEPYLRRQIELVRPRVILLMGRVAAQAMLGTEASIASLRGHAHRIDVTGVSVPVIVTYHPAYLLRNLADKAKVWADMCLAREVFERSPARA
ncbi:MAG TPA: uracil-DNA glycosylase [Burkholderiaceae bacterium]|jgi:DNA polymerase